MEDNERVFKRTASGLVRQMSWWDGFLSNVGTMNLFWITYLYMWATGMFPGSSISGACFIITIALIFHFLVYALFSAAMPRSGGDYVFNTRTLNPAVGFTVNFSMVIWNMFWMGFTAYMFVTAGMSTTASILGNLYKVPWLINLGTALFENPLLILFVGTITLLFATALALWGLKPFFKTMGIGFVIGVIGTIVLASVLILSDQNEFIEKFNKFVFTSANIPNYYERVISDATSKFGFVKSSGKFFSVPTLWALAFAFQPLGFGIWSSYFSGEIKNAKNVKVHIGSMLGSLLFTGFALALMGVLVIRVMGYNFIGATGLFYENFANLEGGISNNAAFFGTLLTNNPILQLLIGISIMAWTFLYIQPSIMMVSRCMFAWSIDRLAPKALTHVSKKSHVPDYALYVACIIAIAFLAKFCWPGQIFSIYGGTVFIGGGTITFGVVALSAILFPFLKKTKQLYELSSINYKVGNFPFISLCGILSLGVMIYITFVFIYRPEFHIRNWPAILFMLLLYVAGFIWYRIVKVINLKKGIDTEKLATEIPPE